MNKRYNIFYQVHKGLRAQLFETGLLLQRTDFDHKEETDAVAASVQETIELFELHAHTEDHFILDAIEKEAAGIVQQFENEHLMDEILGNKLQALLRIIQSCETTEERMAAGGALRLVYNEFLAFNLTHMAKEEDQLNQFLWSHYSDQQLMAITQQIVAHHAPDVMQRVSSWMMRGLSNNEIRNWLLEIKNNAPDFVFGGMLQLASRTLPCQRCNAIQEQLTEGAMLA